MTPRVNPTLFDKLVADHASDAMPGGEAGRAGVGLAATRFRAIERIERFNEAALRSTLLRELGWLLNTTNLDAVQDLSDVPEVRSSTLNYGLGDVSGTLLTRNGVQARARDMREAILRFEPRVDRGSLEVEPLLEDMQPNSVGFLIRGDVSAATRAMPVEIRTDIEVDTGVVSFLED